MNRASRRVKLFLGSFFVCSIFAAIIKADLGLAAPSLHSPNRLPAHTELVVSSAPDFSISDYFSSFSVDSDTAPIIAGISPDYGCVLTAFENRVRGILKSRGLSCHTLIAVQRKKVLPDEFPDEEAYSA
jgi:hypothetical protein